MPDFYAVSYPTSQDPGVAEPRRSRTVEYRRLVFDPCKAGKLALEGYRWSAYLYGGEAGVALKTYTTSTRHDTLLSRRLGDCAAFRDAMAEEGYNGLPLREVEFNIYLPHELIPSNPIGHPITRQQAQDYLKMFPIPRWVDRESPLYRGWELCPDNWEGKQTLAELGLTMEDVQQRMTEQNSNPPSPFAFGPPPNLHTQGTPRHLQYSSTNSTMSTPGRNQQGRFITRGQTANINVNKKEYEAIDLGAAALAYILDQPDSFSKLWVSDAKKHKSSLDQLALKCEAAFTAVEPKSPRDYINRIHGGPPTTPTPASRKRRAEEVDLTQDEDGLEASPTIVTSTPLGNPFQTMNASPAVTVSNKNDSNALPTVQEELKFFRSSTKFMAKFGQMTAKDSTLLLARSSLTLPTSPFPLTRSSPFTARTLPCAS